MKRGPEVKFRDVFKNICCVDFKKALKDGTDNEGYGSLLVGTIEDDESDFIKEVKIGYGLKSIKYCPWCGKKIKNNISMKTMTILKY